ncbi:MAG: sugar-binding transcriptional regulator [Acidobacteriaceae bacterium]|nr:sugar-binding transcriptional regulator [Acidobacteriaceae bacterium]
MDSDHKRLLIKASRLYYEQDMTQAEIGKQLRLSRQKVQRILDEAREEGVVNITIHPIMEVFTDLENALESRFGLSEALVLETSGPDDQNTIAREVGVVAAEYLTRLIRPNDKIVMSWGNSLLGMVNALTARSHAPQRNLAMIQGLGSLGNPNAAIHGAELVRRAARALGAQPVLFPAPAIAATETLRDAIYADPYVTHTLDMARSADLAFVGIGSVDSDAIAVPDLWRFMPRSVMPNLLKKGAVGSINLRYFDKNGRIVASEINERVIGLTLDELKKIHRVVGVAGGSGKLPAIRAAVQARLIDVLITDHLTAKALLSDPD